MDIDVFNEATELYNKYKMCESLMATLSNEKAVRGQKYKDALAKFAETFKGEFMMFVHERMTACGEAFEDCGKCDCDKQNEQLTTTESSDEYEIAIGTRVMIKSGKYEGKVGTIAEVPTGFVHILVKLDDIDEPVEFAPDQLTKYNLEV